ncbi:MAG: DUF4065 domain-containing protein [Bacteroidetes bacterium]|nr:DUF4065 domain-containing protein [Bacteroidota bacterium]
MQAVINSPFTVGKAILQKELKEHEFRNDVFTITQHYYKCKDTGQEFTNDEVDQVNVNQVYNQYREKYGVPFLDEIKDIRIKYGLPATKMSEILGFGVNTYRQYEQGDIPSVSNGRLIMAADDPKEFKSFLEASKHVLDENNYKKISKRVEEHINERKQKWLDEVFIPNYIFQNTKSNHLTGYKKPNLERIAQVISLFSKKVNNLWITKLNKLLFYTDFLHFNRTGFSICGISYRAIQLGPVPATYDKIYNTLVDYGFAEKQFEQFDNGNYGEYLKGLVDYIDEDFLDSEKRVLNDVLDKLGSMGSNEIVEYSHKEKVWLECEKERKVISYREYGFDLNNF